MKIITGLLFLLLCIIKNDLLYGIIGIALILDYESENNKKKQESD